MQPISAWKDLITATYWLFRTLKRGDWLWLLLAVIIASSSVTLIKQLSQSVEQSMLLKASESLGADLVIRSSRPLDTQWQIIAASDYQLQTTQSTRLVTMASTDNQFQLVELIAIENNYPLRGTLLPESSWAFSKLQAQQAWISPRLQTLMSLTPEQAITLGESQFELSGLLTPPSTLSPMATFAPQMWIPLASLNETGLLGPGSRVTYELGFSGERSRIEAFAKLIEKDKPVHWQILSAHNPNEDLERTLNTASWFLDLAALSAVLIAGMSIMIASRFYLQRWQNSLALMRAMGANQKQIVRLFAWQLSLLAIVGSALGVVIGAMLFWLISPLLAEYFTPFYQAPLATAAISGFLTGLLVLMSFAWQAFQQALNISALSILKERSRDASWQHWLMTAVILIVLLMLLFDGEAVWWVIAGLAGLVILLWLISSLILTGLMKLQNVSRGWFKIALATLIKQPTLLKIQIASLGSVLFILILLSFVRVDLLSQWQLTLKDDTPNTFLLNIQPYQKESVDSLLKTYSIETQLVPMVRGRLSGKNGQTIQASDFESPRAQRQLQREANIALLAKTPQHNKVVAQLPQDKLTLPTLVSVEVELAKRLNIQLGDVLSFNINGQLLDYQVHEFREVVWQSFELNFFFILNRDPQLQLPVTYISSFYLPNKSPSGNGMEHNDFQKTLVEQSPGVVFFDVSQIIQQIQDIMSQASMAVSGLYLFSLLSSIIVIFTSILASQQGRVQQWVLLRTLGATDPLLIKIGLTEFILLGLTAGLFAATLAQITSGILSVQLFNLPFSLQPQLWLTSLLSGSLLLLLIAWLTQRHYLKRSFSTLKTYLNT